MRNSPEQNRKLAKVAFGGGCFWCTEAVFLILKGVVAVTPGYAGGQTNNPTYEEVSTGETGHAEVVLVEYDEKLISFEKVLEVFIASHDPTTLNRQGNDYGAQYRSILLYSLDDQRQAAENYIKKLVAEKRYDKPIVTEIRPLEKFYPAEAYHEKYYATHPDAGYSKTIIAPKVAKVRQSFPDLT